MVRLLAPLVCAVTLAVCVAMPAHAQSPSLLIEDMTWTEVRDAIAPGKTTAVNDAGRLEEKEQMRAYAAEHKIAVDSRAGFDDTSQVLFIDCDHKWIRKDTLVKDDGKGGAGVTGDQAIGTVALGEMFVGYTITDAVDQSVRS